MSAAGRGPALDPSGFEIYNSPLWVPWRLMEATDLPGGHWIECCAGDGNIIRAIKEPRPECGWNGARTDIKWSAIEIRPECEKPLVELVGAGNVHIGDFREFDITGVEVFITNPPFSLAESIIRHAIAQKPQWVVMLTRLNFLESDERCEWLSTCMPDAYVLPNRPVFRRNNEGKLATDATAYGWLVWFPPAHPNKTGSLKMLKPTPIEVRKQFYPPLVEAA